MKTFNEIISALNTMPKQEKNYLLAYAMEDMATAENALKTLKADLVGRNIVQILNNVPPKYIKQKVYYGQSWRDNSFSNSIRYCRNSREELIPNPDWDDKLVSYPINKYSGISSESLYLLNGELCCGDRPIERIYGYNAMDSVMGTTFLDNSKREALKFFLENPKAETSLACWTHVESPLVEGKKLRLMSTYKVDVFKRSESHPESRLFVRLTKDTYSDIEFTHIYDKELNQKQNIVSKKILFIKGDVNANPDYFMVLLDAENHMWIVGECITDEAPIDIFGLVSSANIEVINLLHIHKSLMKCGENFFLLGSRAINLNTVEFNKFIEAEKKAIEKAQKVSKELENLTVFNMKRYYYEPSSIEHDIFEKLDNNGWEYSIVPLLPERKYCDPDKGYIVILGKNLSKTVKNGVFKLHVDDAVKGWVIGKQGKNIKALTEKLQKYCPELQKIILV